MNNHNIDIDELYERLMSTRRLIEAKQQKIDRLKRDAALELSVLRRMQESEKIIEGVLSEQAQLNLDFAMALIWKFERYEYWLVDGEVYVRDCYKGQVWNRINWGKGEFKEVDDGMRTIIKNLFEINKMEMLYAVGTICFYGYREDNIVDLFKENGYDDDLVYEEYFWDYEYLEDKESNKLEKNRYIMQLRKEKAII